MATYTTTGSLSTLTNRKTTPFIAFIRANGERLQLSYASIHHVMLQQPTTQGETCLIYAAGYKITLKGEHFEPMLDKLLSCHIAKISQAKKDTEKSINEVSQDNTQKPTIVTSMKWDIAYSGGN